MARRGAILLPAALAWLVAAASLAAVTVRGFGLAIAGEAANAGRAAIALGLDALDVHSLLQCLG